MPAYSLSVESISFFKNLQEIVRNCSKLAKDLMLHYEK